MYWLKCIWETQDIIKQVETKVSWSEKKVENILGTKKYI